tara:strand:+ start:1933 stop:2169 length:237 start_codon:yes stop_codon:yes gene_type:complete
MKKNIMLPVALIAMMVVACGPSQEEIAAQEQVIADSVAAHEAQVILDAEAAQTELDAAAQAEVATTDSSVTATDASTK